MFKDRITQVLNELNSFNPDREQLFYEYVRNRLENDLKRYNQETTNTLNSLENRRVDVVMKEMVE